VPLRDKPAARHIGLRKLLLLRRGQVPAQIFHRTAQFNKHVMGQGVVALLDRQGIESLR
jgi:hypothetical protein